MNIDELKQSIRSVPDFPKQGIMFRDITTLLGNANAFHSATELLYQHFKGRKIVKIVGIESRGFIFGAALALRMHCAFVPIRKPKKLPAETLREEYQLEYGTDAIEIHTDAITKGENVLLIDDLLATGGTMKAAINLVNKLGATISGIAFLIELDFLNGRKLLGEYEIFSLIHYDGE